MEYKVEWWMGWSGGVGCWGGVLGWGVGVGCWDGGLGWDVGGIVSMHLTKNLVSSQ